MRTQNSEVPQVIYVGDAYCGWCWGFAQRLEEFEAANRDRIAFTAISGGLFVGDRAASLASYPHIPEANARIARITGAEFGLQYQALLQDGRMVMDSQHAGAALAALRHQSPNRAIHWLQQLQEAFYKRGKSLSDIATIVEVAESNGLNGEVTRSLLEDGRAVQAALEDFAAARLLGATTYPTLLLVNGNHVVKLPGTGTSLSALNEALTKALSDQGAHSQASAAKDELA
ncbi:DsbA family protein [Stenotrophomonas tuberculopleuritidis]|uniref:DsbA family protein n=1 Tax=Stenotrophomonas tuberculopleuritidis TaxID=3055079 RepID=UPI0026E57089|nr:DsbA family protein [Stenotrophomonas sp. 704A1]